MRGWLGCVGGIEITPLLACCIIRDDEKKGARKMYFLGVFCLIAGFAVPLTLTCSCHPDYLSETRSEVICNAYSNQVSIYKARITTAKCKCLLRQSLFSCIDFKLNSSQNVVGRVQGLYNCSSEESGMRLSYYYGNCPSIISKGGK